MDAATKALVDADHARFRAQPLGHPAFPGKTIGDAHDAFAKVADKENWKFQVSRVVQCHESEVAFICYAMVFMCGGGAQAKPVPGGYHFTHPGYYAVIGG